MARNNIISYDLEGFDRLMAVNIQGLAVMVKMYPNKNVPKQKGQNVPKRYGQNVPDGTSKWKL